MQRAMYHSEALPVAKRKWLAKAEKHVGKQAWLATMPWSNEMKKHASSLQTIASSADEKEFHVDVNSYSEAQRKVIS